MTTLCCFLTGAGNRPERVNPLVVCTRSTSPGQARGCGCNRCRRAFRVKPRGESVGEDVGCRAWGCEGEPRGAWEPVVRQGGGSPYRRSAPAGWRRERVASRSPTRRCWARCSAPRCATPSARTAAHGCSRRLGQALGQAHSALMSGHIILDDDAHAWESTYRTGCGNLHTTC
jgi:hypothetical protein